VLTVLAAKGAGGFDDAPMFDQWPHARGPLAVNPLYRAVSERADGLRYARALPLGSYAADNPELTRYLPAAVHVTADVARRAAAGEHPDELEPHVRRLAVLTLPPALVDDPWPRPPAGTASDAR
jgi:hypothetical protein